MPKSFWTSGNRLLLLEDGEEFYPELLEAIESAQKEILGELYIFQEDRVGQEFAKAFMEAALRGVRVSLILDAFGSFDLSSRFVHDLRAAGVQVLFYEGLAQVFKERAKFMHRLHRKVFLIDEKKAFVGGINIEQRHLRRSRPESFLDYSVYVEGPVVHKIARLTQLFLLRHKKDWKAYFKLRLKRKRRREHKFGEARVAYVVRNNFSHRWKIENLYLRGMQNAKQKILIANAYFLPGFRILRAMIQAAKRGVEVKIILQGKAEFWFLHHATKALYRSLLQNGICVYEYLPRLLHAKVATFDGELSTVGSCNLDPLSLMINLEANLWIEDNAFSENLEKHLEDHIKNDCREIKLDYVKRMNIMERFFNHLSYYLIRSLIYLVKPGYLAPKSKGD